MGDGDGINVGVGFGGSSGGAVGTGVGVGVGVAVGETVRPDVVVAPAARSPLAHEAGIFASAKPEITNAIAIINGKLFLTITTSVRSKYRGRTNAKDVPQSPIATINSI